MDEQDTPSPILERIHLKDYAPQYGDQYIDVCVDPVDSIISEIAGLYKGVDISEYGSDEFAARLSVPFSRLWSFGADTYTPDDVLEIRATDPRLWNWLTLRTVNLIDRYRKLVKLFNAIGTTRKTNDDDLRRIKDAFIHLSPLQRKIITWRVDLLAIRARAFRFLDSLFRR